MRLYSQRDEENIRAERQVREWIRSGFFDKEQAKRLEAELEIDLRRTNKFLRLVLFAFGLVIVAATFVLAVIQFDLDEELPFALAALPTAGICFMGAQHLAGKQRFYRFGIEEALAVSAVIYFGLGVGAMVSMVDGTWWSESAAFAGLLGASAAAFVVYRRFGYVYAALGAMACLAASNFQIRQSVDMERVLVVGMLFAVVVIVRSKRLQHGDEFPGDEYGIILAAAYAGIYVATNIQLFNFDLPVPSPTAFSPTFYWSSYVLTWLLPAAGLYLGLRDKDRLLFDMSLASALATLITNKMYLGLTRQTWDPILLGVLLVSVAVLVRRWLATGANGQRNGFIADRILSSDKRSVSLVGSATVVLQPDIPVSTPQEQGFKPGGGRSGGAGASSSF